MTQQNISGEQDLTSLIKLVSDLKETEPNGRVNINLLSNNEDDDILLMEGDRLTIPERVNHVYTYGEVSSEGTVLFQSNETIDYFLEKSGGLTENAQADGIYVLHPGSTQRYSKKRNIF